MQYYHGNGPIGGRNVSRILEQVTIALAADPARKFSVTEQAFFQMCVCTSAPLSHYSITRAAPTYLLSPLIIALPAMRMPPLLAQLV